MEKTNVDYESILIEQLKKLGVEHNIIPRLIKDLINSFINNPLSDIYQINDYLSVLGWNDIQLDYRTFEIARTFFEMNN